MVYLIVGSFSFLLFLLFDLNQLRSISRTFRSFFFLGSGLLAAATILLLLQEGWGNTPFLPRLAGAMGMAIALGLLIHSLFIALGFKESYLQEGGGKALVTWGAYSLCRHPGVLWFILFYLSLWLFSGSILIFQAGLLWSLLNVLYALFQDRYLLPRLFPAYPSYRQTTPFLLPTLASLTGFLGLQGKERKTHEL